MRISIDRFEEMADEVTQYSCDPGLVGEPGEVSVEPTVLGRNRYVWRRGYQCVTYCEALPLPWSVVLGEGMTEGVGDTARLAVQDARAQNPVTCDIALAVSAALT